MDPLPLTELGVGGYSAQQSYSVLAGPLQLNHENVKLNKYVSLYTVAMLYVVFAVMFISVTYIFLSLGL